MSVKKVVIIGSGFSGLSAACFMAKAGWQVTVLEKHAIPGGRARKLEAEGFTFDMGPSWYWMPDVFERFFKQFDRSVSDYYALSRLDPSYKVYWIDGGVDIPANYPDLKKLFESIETGSAAKLDSFLKEAEYKYKTGIQKLVLKPGLSISEFIEWDVIKGVFKLDLFGSMKRHVADYFKDKRLRELMEFPVLFLGALPENTPALYSLMNYADIIGGTWFPKGGMYSVVEGMFSLATELGVHFGFEKNVTKLQIDNGNVTSIITSAETYRADVVIGSADYHHVETQLLEPSYRSYSDKYWESRVMAPGSLIYYVGLNKKLENIKHHMLFFDAPFKEHAEKIYTTKEWPDEPLFYVSATTVTDKLMAPEGCENLFFLVPVAPGLEDDNERLREHYFAKIVARMERHLGQSITEHIVYKKTYAHRDFINDYNSYKGNAYGLANTLKQTAILKPSIKSKKVKNLYYTGQLTVPGPGVPPSLISGEVVAKQVVKDWG
ncbi:phytoene desaturase family protein [Segetibacter aerophilus]|uniref:Phytoene dehydrogenase n=1 Tax=Segetibacter aerophilus TaxID=670293 RepID=A0A512BI22_9BACT|nr:phytoene desaturase family protein [Segetibacter aerophilus]GEO11634.1 phytoene dehydrogenase [Segetibacter aerophilus]